MNFSRRNLLVGAGALVAAPAIVRASSLMPVSNRLLLPNQFDTYEEGPWVGEVTPGWITEVPHQYGKAVGRYARVGNVVHICAKIEYGGWASATITGLPL